MSTAELDRLVQQWLKWDQNTDTRAEIQRLHSAVDNASLRLLLERRLQFGTAGLRARMGAGNACINDLTIIQTSQGLAAYLSEQHGAPTEGPGAPGDGAPGVLVGYDGRHNSRRFAELTAAAMARRGLCVWLFGAEVPTPWVAFGVRELGACAGVMITASHNPRHDNGYKVYWSNGAQILPPHDARVQAAILEHLEPAADAWSTEPYLARAVDPLERVTSAYLSALQQLPAARSQGEGTKAAPSFVATAMHGVAHRYLQQAFSFCCLPAYTPVTEQMLPDGDFPTVAFPNPEEGPALALALTTADRAGAQLVLANDPDADRLAVAERLGSARASGGSWHVFTGNELGALLGWWCWQCHGRQQGSTGSVCHLIASTVSSKLLRAMAGASNSQHLRFHETLTGFKWMANLADRLERGGETVLFAFEEAIGFMCGTHVLDKDGISAAVCVAQMARELYMVEGVTLLDRLHQLYEQYGHHLSNNSYYICYQPAVVTSIFERIRHWREGPTLDVADGGGEWRYPAALETGPGETARTVEVVSVRDLTTGHDTSREDGLADLPTCPNSQMITFTFRNGVVLTLRTSGTEPKIKWYAELCGAVGQPASQLKQELDELVEAVKVFWLQPEENKLQARPE
nr:Pgm-2a-like protein [Parasacculina yatsui]